MKFDGPSIEQFNEDERQNKNNMSIWLRIQWAKRLSLSSSLLRSPCECVCSNQENHAKKNRMRDKRTNN